jgi:hypothetical protein
MLGFSVFRGKVKELAFTSLFEGKNLASTLRTLRRKLGSGFILTDRSSYDSMAGSPIQVMMRNIFVAKNRS